MATVRRTDPSVRQDRVRRKGPTGSPGARGRCTRYVPPSVHHDDARDQYLHGTASDSGPVTRPRHTTARDVRRQATQVATCAGRLLTYGPGVEGPSLDWSSSHHHT